MTATASSVPLSCRQCPAAPRLYCSARSKRATRRRPSRRRSASSRSARLIGGGSAYGAPSASPSAAARRAWLLSLPPPCAAAPRTPRPGRPSARPPYWPHRSGQVSFHVSFRVLWVLRGALLVAELAKVFGAYHRSLTNWTAVPWSRFLRMFRS
jgi:hypothetical protein